ncbi:DUF397 domain-containing protein [Nonomuraea sp. NPDC046570]|uniref:DUF397 domain-containing protein n=1 Tax=Nonomuraea sp. NPDC046570 TaxID=3155255 RepID=UPI0033D6F6FA
MEPATWRKSTFSGNNGECVEVAWTPTAVKVRHSQRPDDEVLRFTPAEWTAFVAGVRNGEFDHVR